MNEADNVRFTEWMGCGEYAWNLYTATADDVTFDQPYRWQIAPLFQSACLDVREDELFLDALGCLDAPL